MSFTVEFLQSKAYADSTTKSRESAVLAFARFCVISNLPFFPASTEVLCQYVAYLANHNVKASSISSYLAHIGTFHKLKGLPDPTKVFAISTTVKGVARVRGSRPDSKAPLTPVELLKLKNTLDPASSLHRTFWACLVVGFWSYLRCNNLVQKTKRNFDSLRHVSPDNLSVSSVGVTITLQRTKTIQFNDYDLRIPLVKMDDNPLCPVRAIKEMWELCPPYYGHSLFLFRGPSGSISPLVHSHLNKRESPHPYLCIEHALIPY